MLVEWNKEAAYRDSTRRMANSPSSTFFARSAKKESRSLAAKRWRRTGAEFRMLARLARSLNDPQAKTPMQRKAPIRFQSQRRDRASSGAQCVVKSSSREA